MTTLMFCMATLVSGLSTPPISRRAFIAVGTAATAAAPCLAADPPATALAKVTDMVELDFTQQLEGSSGETRTISLEIGLFGRDAPTSVSVFKSLASGQLKVPCGPEPDLSGEVMERGKQSKKAAYRTCLGYETEPVSYAYSQVWSIQKGRRIDAGLVQGKFALREPPATDASESAALSHDAPGLISVKRGGGNFDFGITTAPAPEDNAEFIVIGRVLKGLDALAELDAAPVVKAAEALGVESASSSRGKACFYGSPNSYCAQNKPLRKILLRNARVLS